MRASEFDGAFRCLGTGRQQKNFLQTLGRDGGETLDKFGAWFTWEDIIVQQAMVDLAENSLPDFCRGQGWRCIMRPRPMFCRSAKHCARNSLPVVSA